MKLLKVLICSLLLSTAAFSSPFEQDLNADPLFIEHFELPWMNNVVANTLWKSADYTGAIYVVEAYFKNCPYCNDNAPLVNQLATAYSMQERVKVLDVGRDTRAGDYQAWIAMHSPNHPVLNDGGMKVLGPLRISGYPTTVVLDCNMREVFRTVGGWDSGDAAAVRRAIDAQLQVNCQ
jgi:hypothetical protein